LISVEDFLGDRICGEGWLQGRKLTEVEKDSLETVVTMDELKESLDNSNFESTSGWDGVSFKEIL
jgi:hypothetical protein